MGGGASLGAYAIAALTETLKLLVIFGRDERCVPYERVVLDGLSGSSVGSLSLLILLRTLMNKDQMMSAFIERTQIPKECVELKEELKKELETEYGQQVWTNGLKDEDSNYGKRDRENQLLALQLAQKILKYIWVERMDAADFIRPSAPREGRRESGIQSASIDPSFLARIVRDFTLDGEPFDPARAVLLDPVRVVFACSLTNMLSIDFSKDREHRTDLRKAMAPKPLETHHHSELRVFDFVLDQKEVTERGGTDRCWMSLSKAGKNKGLDWNIDTKEAWSVVGATAIACAAPPFATKPVFLKRFKEEFNEVDNKREREQENEDKFKIPGYWPEGLKEIQKELKEISAYTIKDCSYLDEIEYIDEEPYQRKIDYNSFNFPYVDGGVFFNEPVRHAYRIARFQDFGKDKEEFDRLIIHADPNTSTTKSTSFTRSFPYSKNAEPASNPDFNPTPTGEGQNWNYLLGLYFNQGRIWEEDRIRDTEGKLKLRNELFTYLRSFTKLFPELPEEQIRATFRNIKEKLNTDIIPFGTRDHLEFLLKYIIQTAKDIYGQDYELNRDQIKTIETVLKNRYLSNRYLRQIDDILKSNLDSYHSNGDQRNVFGQVMFRLMIDFSLGTLGKYGTAEKLSISAYSPDSEVPADLPGSELLGIAGFADKSCRSYSFRYGRLSSTLNLIQRNGMRIEKLDLSEQPVQKGTGRSDQGFDNLNETKGKWLMLSELLREVERKQKETLRNEGYHDPTTDLSGQVNVKLLKRAFEGVFRSAHFHPIHKTALNIGSGFKNLFRALRLAYLIALRLFSGKPSVKSVLEILRERWFSLSNRIGHKELTPITISIRTSEYCCGYLKLKLNDGKYLKLRPECSHKIDRNRFPERKSKNAKTGKNPRARGQFEHKFRVYHMGVLKEIMDTNQDGTDSRERIALSPYKSAPLPGVDPRLDKEQWLLEFQKNCSNREIVEFRFKGSRLNLAKGWLMPKFNSKRWQKFLVKGDQRISQLKEALRDKNSTLYYSLKYANFHVCPTLEIDLDELDTEPNNAWSFIENTRAVHLDLIDGFREQEASHARAGRIPS